MFSERRFAAIWDFASKYSHAALAGGMLKVATLAVTSTKIRNRRIIAMHTSRSD
jgi:hypothetical protein